LYCGITKDLERRILAHNNGTGGSYTRAHRPVMLEHAVDGFTIAEALRLEYDIKQMPRQLKILHLLNQKDRTHKEIQWPTKKQTK
jgi:putative endonuclease